MSILPKSITHLIDEFGRLPGIGPKTAGRLTFYLLGRTKEEVKSFSLALVDLKEKIKNCRNCYNITEQDICSICLDHNRNNDTLMVVAEPLDIVALEKTNFKGKYFVLGGVISPIDGIGPEDLNIWPLVERVKKESQTLKEIIFATDPSLEGEATAIYISRKIDEAKKEETIAKNISLTRIARGLPVGGDVEYADELTLTRALEGRKEV